MNKAHVTHPELKATFCMDVLGVLLHPHADACHAAAAAAHLNRSAHEQGSRDTPELRATLCLDVLGVKFPADCRPAAAAAAAVCFSQQVCA
jgi:hypothetical protein